MVGGLLGLSVRVCFSPAEDLSLIFAEPQLQDVEVMICEKYILDLVNQIMKGKSKGKQLKEENFEVKFEAPNLFIPEDSALNEDNKVAETENNELGDIIDELQEDDNIDELQDDQHNDDQLQEKEDLDYNTENDDPMDEEKPERKSRITVKKLPIKQVDSDKFLCTLCNKTSADRSNARKHAKTHGIGLEPIEDRTCPHCRKVFDYATLCRKHIKRKCKSMMKGKCDHCDLVFESGVKLKEHIKTEHDYDKFKCAYCDHIASSTQNKSNHEKRIHLNMDCKLCKKLFSSDEEKGEHVCLEPERYKCDECEKSYKAKGELRNHVLVVHEGLRHPCNFCEDVLSSVQALKRHEKSFHQNNPRDNVCEVCSQAFTHKDTLKKHILTHDKVLRSDPCPYCGKVLRNRNVLRQHIKTLHEKNFSVVCEDCGQRFANKHRLEIHSEMSHLKGKMYVCQTCGKNFLGKKRLQNHMISKHPKGQKFVTCEYCGEDVGEKQLRSHVVEAHKSHAYKFQCPHCLKKFPVKGHIKRHIRVHTGARPYLCRGCGNYYVDLEAVKDHIRKEHSGDVSLAHYDVAKDVNNPYV